MTHTHKLVQDASGTVAIARSEVEAERIAACLEACDGIATEDLDGCTKRLVEALERAQRLLSLCVFDAPEDLADLDFVNTAAGMVDVRSSTRAAMHPAAALCEEGR